MDVCVSYNIDAVWDTYFFVGGSYAIHSSKDRRYILLGTGCFINLLFANLLFAFIGRCGINCLDNSRVPAKEKIQKSKLI